MAGILIKAGDNMPLHVQLGCYETGLFPRAILKNDSGVFIKNVDLSDRGDGLYTEHEPMPSKNIIATYKTFSDAARTIVSDDSAGLDIFILDTFAPTRRDDKIVGIIEQGSLVGAISADTVITGYFETNNIDGQLTSDTSLTGEIQGDILIGVICK